MPRTLALLLAASLGFLTGCERPCPPPCKKLMPCDNNEYLTATGLVGAAIVIDPTITLDVVPAAKTCPAKTFNTYQSTYKLEVRYTANNIPYHYWAVVGRDSIFALQDNGALFLCEGWVYVWDDPCSGPSPANYIENWVQTEHVSAGADGSAIAVHVPHDRSKSTVYGYKNKLKVAPENDLTHPKPLPDPAYSGTIADSCFEATNPDTLNNPILLGARTTDRNLCRNTAMQAGAPDPGT